ncbi:hypothetical protein Tco_0494411 [Tanacetum coccineum]
MLDCDLVTYVQPEFVLSYGSSPLKSVKLISAMKARTLISHGCQGFLASVMDTSLESPNIENLSVVREFADVFPDELPGLPPAREIEFGIELIPGAEPISKAPYRMAPVELKELKEQLQEMLENGFIRPSVSPWGAPVLFVKKKDGSIALGIDYREHSTTEEVVCESIPKCRVLVTMQAAFLGHIDLGRCIIMIHQRLKLSPNLGQTNYCDRTDEKGEKFEWTDERQESFVDLKDTDSSDKATVFQDHDTSAENGLMMEAHSFSNLLFIQVKIEQQELVVCYIADGDSNVENGRDFHGFRYWFALCLWLGGVPPHVFVPLYIYLLLQKDMDADLGWFDIG